MEPRQLKESDYITRERNRSGPRNISSDRELASCPCKSISTTCPGIALPSASSPFTLSVQYPRRSSQAISNWYFSNPFFPDYAPEDFQASQFRGSHHHHNHPINPLSSSHFANRVSPYSSYKLKKEKPYCCPTCNRKYFTLPPFELHRKNCSGPRLNKNSNLGAFICYHCPGKSFETEKAIYSHTKAVHGPKGRDPFPGIVVNGVEVYQRNSAQFDGFSCSRCTDKTFATEKALYSHTKAVHGPKGRDPAIKTEKTEINNEHSKPNIERNNDAFTEGVTFADGITYSEGITFLDGVPLTKQPLFNNHNSCLLRHNLKTSISPSTIKIETNVDQHGFFHHDGIPFSKEEALYSGHKKLHVPEGCDPNIAIKIENAEKLASVSMSY